MALRNIIMIGFLWFWYWAWYLSSPKFHKREPRLFFYLESRNPLNIGDFISLSVSKIKTKRQTKRKEVTKFSCKHILHVSIYNLLYLSLFIFLTFHKYGQRQRQHITIWFFRLVQLLFSIINFSNFSSLYTSLEILNC